MAEKTFGAVVLALSLAASGCGNDSSASSDQGSGGQSAGGSGAAQGGGSGSGTGGAGVGGSAGSGTEAGGSAGSSGATGTGGGSAGSAGSGGAPSGSTGCGATSWPESGETYTLTVGTTEREFIVAIPDDYDSSQPHRVIFAWHGMTGTAQQIAGFGNYYGLRTPERGRDSTIFVAGQGLLQNGDSGNTGWWNTNGGDLAFVDALLEWLGENYCVDSSRIFSTGFSFGGMFSHYLGCARGDVFRAVAPMAGSFFNYYGFGGPDECPRAVPVWSTHGSNDMVVTLDQGEAARAVWLATNGCQETTSPVEPSPCVAYQGCEAPVHWCQHDGEHMVPSFAAAAIWSFFSQY